MKKSCLLASSSWQRGLTDHFSDKVLIFHQEYFQESRILLVLIQPPTARPTHQVNCKIDQQHSSMAPLPKNEQRVLALKCKWEQCTVTLPIAVEKYQEFAEHVMTHVDDVLATTLQEEDGSRIQNDEALAPLVIPYKCGWFGCSWEIRGNQKEFTRHVLFHAYHSKLKCLGAFAIIADKLKQCSFDVETQDLLPDLSDPFLCKFESCGMEFVCPDKFYRHVDRHGNSANREDILVTTGEKQNLTSTVGDGKDWEGFAIKKLTQAVCRWEGCSYLAKDPWKIKEHCRTHTGERQIACPSCGMFFANKTKLADHLIRQDIESYENFQCSHCLKRCASERLLRDHMRHHVNHVKCPHCDMTCPNPSALRSHLKFKHSLDRPFKCSMCNFSCKTKHDLLRHEEAHFGKRFHCEVEGCIYVGTTITGLRYHVKKLHEQKEKKKYMCHICDRKTSRGYLLTKHLKKAHHFSWPSGHSRFRYKLDEDGYHRLQMVRFESAELTEQLSGESQEVTDVYDNLTVRDESIPMDEGEDGHPNSQLFNAGSIQVSADSLQASDVLDSSGATNLTGQFNITKGAAAEALCAMSTADDARKGNVPGAAVGSSINKDISTTTDTHERADNPGNFAVRLTEKYEAILEYYEMTNDPENIKSTEQLLHSSVISEEALDNDHIDDDTLSRTFEVVSEEILQAVQH